jgi:signal transduction histidine kinase
LVIADDGPGLEAADPEELLERTTSDYSGRGLGLPLVARLTAVHNGEVSLESLPGGGTRVELSLPAAGQRAPDLS